MKGKKNRRLRPPEFSPRIRWALTVLLLLCAALGLHLLCQMIGTLDFSRGRFSSYFHYPVIFLLNLLPLVLLLLFFYFATNRAWLAFLLTGLIATVMVFINYFKVVLRGDPFVVEDFFIVAEGVGIVGNYSLHFPAWFYIAVALLLGGTLVLWCFARGKVPKRLWWVRVTGLLLCVAFGAAAWSWWYRDPLLYESQKNYSLFNAWKSTEDYVSHGFFWSFLHSFEEAFPPAPEGYSAEAAEAELAGYTDAPIPEDQRVNIVVTMLESYSDLSVFDSIHFTADPYASFHALQAESYHGTLVDDVVGGGTINTERSFLTGFTYPHPRYRVPTSSYVYYLASQGYRTEGAHPGFDWFYSRDVVNARLGFDRYLFMENHFNDLTDEEHAMDDVFFPEMARIYDEASADGRPYFSFSVTYQNHSPYDDTAMTGTEYVSHEGLSDATYCEVNNYLNGVADTGKRVAAYVDTFRDREEPVVLVFFGDHKPSFGAENARYEELGVNAAEGSPEGCWNLYTSPYLIWANDAAKELLGFDFTGEGRTISPAFLMAELFDCCGWDGPAWMQYQRQMRDMLPVIHQREIFLVDGALTRELPAEVADRYRAYTIVEYYMRTVLHAYGST